MYCVKKEYIYLVQGLLLKVAQDHTDHTGGAVEVFPQVTVEFNTGGSGFEPLKGNLCGTLVFGYGVKWLAYLFQEGELTISDICVRKFSEQIKFSIGDDIIKKCSQHREFGLCPFTREDAEKFVTMMEQKYPGMPLPIEYGKRGKLVDAILALQEKNSDIELTGGIEIKE